MGRGRSKAGASTTKPAPAQKITPAVAVTAATAATTIMGNPVTNASSLTDTEAATLRAAEEASYDPTTMAAVKMYISNTDFDKQGHSLSQTMNYLLDNGVDLDAATAKGINYTYGLRLTDRDVASMQYTNNRMGDAVHAIGKDVKLQRGAHDDLLRNTFGIQNYANMTQAQLQKALVGKAFRNDSYMSTSYDVKKNPFLASSSGVSGGREVVYNIKAGKNTKVLFGAKAQSEIVINKGTNFRITGVRYTGNTATPRSGRAKPQIEIEIETF